MRHPLRSAVLPGGNRTAGTVYRRADSGAAPIVSGACKGEHEAGEALLSTPGAHAMLTTDFVPGAPDWLDLGSADVEASSAFYGGLFGWTFRSAGPDAGGYGFFQLDGRTVAAAGPLMGEG